MKTNHRRKNGTSGITDALMKGHRTARKASFLPRGSEGMRIRQDALGGSWGALCSWPGKGLSCGAAAPGTDGPFSHPRESASSASSRTL